MERRDDRLAKVVPLLARVGDWREVVSGEVQAQATATLPCDERTRRRWALMGLWRGLTGCWGAS